MLKTKFMAVLLLAFAFSATFISAAASFSVSSFSCSPSENVINNVFSCTAQITNIGDAAGAVSTATLYPDSNNWLEESNYAQSSGTSVSSGQSTEVVFSGLRATKSGNNGFSKIMLDSVTDTYVADNNVKVNIVNVVVTVSNSASSAAAGGSVDSTSEISVGGNADVVLTLTIDSGNCNIGSQDGTKSIEGMTDGSKQSRVWTVTQGTSGTCRYTIAATATGSGGTASKTDTTSSTITCTDCTTAETPASSSGGGGGGGGAGGTTTSLGELTSSKSVELSAGAKVSFSIAQVNHTLTLINLSDTYANINIKSISQDFLISFGETKEVDINEDGKSDLSVQLKAINVITKKATFVLAPGTGTVVEGAAGTGTATPGTGTGIPEAGEKIISIGSDFIKKVNEAGWAGWTVLIVVLAVIIVGIVLFIKAVQRWRYLRAKKNIKTIEFAKK